ncbi:MAG: hypothetical protein WC679_03965 [Bacteroidales bacterium]|jgi:hypothetical protein
MAIKYLKLKRNTIKGVSQDKYIATIVGGYKYRPSKKGENDRKILLAEERRY